MIIAHYTIYENKLAGIMPIQNWWETGSAAHQWPISIRNRYYIMNTKQVKRNKPYWNFCTSN